MTFAAGLPAATHAQQLTGEWVGNIDSPPSASLPHGKSELARLSLIEDAGEIRLPLANFKQKLTLVRREGSSIRLELSSLKLVMTGTINGDEIKGEAEVPGIKGTFHLVRAAKVAPEIVASYLGAYRFRNGDYLVIDRFADTPDTLMVTDVKSGEARAFFPRSENQFTAGPFLWVATPPQQTITFRNNGVEVVNSVPPAVGSRGSSPRVSKDFATRILLRHEEVTFKNGDVTLAGTLVTLDSEQRAVSSEQQGKQMKARSKTPGLASKAKHPALVFTHGGGPAVREVYWGLGYLYAARGFVVLSYDKRGVGKSTGNWLAASFQDLADDAVAAAKLLQARTDVNPKQIGFWGQSQGGWIAPLAASRFPDSAFAIALSGGGLTPAETELFDTEYELTKAGYTANEVKDALTFQRLKNDIISSDANDKWEQYAKARATAREQKWYRHQGIDVRGPEKRDDGFWPYMRKFYFYDPSPTLRSMNAPLLAIFGELDTPEGVKAEVRAIEQIMNQAGRRDYLIKVYPSARHNLMEVPRDNTNEYVRLKRFPPGFFETMVDWTMRQLR
jgi:pimeloyl-ACP methyl ester carboxylesterase